jgi:hypothetical protein
MLDSEKAHKLGKLAERIGKAPGKVNRRQRRFANYAAAWLCSKEHHESKSVGNVGVACSKLYCIRYSVKSQRKWAR